MAKIRRGIDALGDLSVPSEESDTKRDKEERSGKKSIGRDVVQCDFGVMFDVI